MESIHPPAIDAKFHAAATGWQTQLEITQAWLVRDRVITAQLSTICTKVEGIVEDLKHVETMRERFYKCMHDIEMLKISADKQDKRNMADVAGKWQLRVALIASLSSLLGVLGTLLVAALK
jgi:hypothetical protein